MFYVPNRELSVDLVTLDIRNFDIILCMDWLASYHASILLQEGGGISDFMVIGMLLPIV